MADQAAGERAEKLAEIRAKLEAISRRPWCRDERHPGYVYCDDSLGSAVAQCSLSHTMAITTSQANANAEFIASAPEFVSFLLEECERAAKDHAADRYLWDVSIKAAWADCKEAREEYERMRREIDELRKSPAITDAMVDAFFASVEPRGGWRDLVMRRDTWAGRDVRAALLDVLIAKHAVAALSSPARGEPTE